MQRTRSERFRQGLVSEKLRPAINNDYADGAFLAPSPTRDIVLEDYFLLRFVSQTCTPI